MMPSRSCVPIWRTVGWRSSADPDVEFKGVALVFRGWELVYGEEVAVVDAG